jgi:hypothetical protein
MHFTAICKRIVLASRKTQISSSHELYTCTGKGYFVDGYQLLDKESTVGIPPENTGSRTWNPPEEWNSAENPGSWAWIQTRKKKNLPIGNNKKDLYHKRIIFRF